MLYYSMNLKQKLQDIKEKKFRDHTVQGAVIGITGAVMARTLAFVAHSFGLTPYFTAILFETVFPAVLVLIQQKMDGHGFSRAIKGACVASLVGFVATSATGIVSH